MRRTFRFMKASFPGGARRDLQQLITDALRRRHAAWDRREPTDQANNEYRFINTHRTRKGVACGVMCAYADGHNQPVMEVDHQAAELPVDQIAPPADGGRRREFIESMIFFAVHRSHAVIMGSVPFPAYSLEQHLNWLLGDTVTRLLPLGHHLVLIDPEVAKRRDGRLKEVKSLTFGCGVGTEMQESVIDGVSKPVFRPVGGIWNAFRDALGALDIRLPDIDFDPNLKPEDLVVKIQLLHRRRKDTVHGGTPVLDPVANALRHLVGGDFAVTFRDGSVLKGSDLKVTTTAEIRDVNGIPDPLDSFDRMIEWLETVAARDDIVLD